MNVNLPAIRTISLRSTALCGAHNYLRIPDAFLNTSPRWHNCDFFGDAPSSQDRPAHYSDSQVINDRRRERRHFAPLNNFTSRFPAFADESLRFQTPVTLRVYLKEICLRVGDNSGGPPQLVLASVRGDHVENSSRGDDLVTFDYSPAISPT